MRTGPTGISPQTIHQHRRADLRLHMVQYRPRGGVVRVFLNQPNADASTPTQGNDHFVGQIHLLGGDCVGGPGHCAPPPRTRRPTDLRARHRKTPRNVHLDVTDAVSKLRKQGAEDFTVHLVSMDYRGRPSRSTLRLDGVSLNFFD